MKHDRKHIFIIVFIFTFGFSQKIPSWYLKGELKGYSQQKYFIGIGEGKNYQRALENASLYIASQMQISISSKLESSFSEISLNGETSSKESFNENITAEVEQSLPALEIIKNEKVKETVYVFAVLEKDRYLNNIKYQLADISLSINTFLSSARGDFKNGNISKSFEGYKLVKQLISNLNTKKIFYNSLSKTRYFDDHNLNLSSIDREIDALINDIKIEVISGNNQTGTNGMLLPEPIIIKLSSQKYNTPILGAELIIKYNNGDIASRGLTDANGDFKFFLYAFQDMNNTKIEAILSPKGLINSKKIKKSNIKTQIFYNVRKKPSVSFDIQIFDQNDYDRIDYLEKKLASSLIKIGNDVSEKSEIIISGKLYEIDSKEIPGKSGIQFMVTSELNLSLLSKFSGKSFGILNLKGKGLSKKSKKDALIKSLKKIKMNKKKIASFISNADRQIKEEKVQQSEKLYEKGIALKNQGRYQDAIGVLAKVELGDQIIFKANAEIKKIQEIIDEIQKENEAKAEKLRNEIIMKEVESSKLVRLGIIEGLE